MEEIFCICTAEYYTATKRTLLYVTMWMKLEVFDFCEASWQGKMNAVQSCLSKEAEQSAMQMQKEQKDDSCSWEGAEQFWLEGRGIGHRWMSARDEPCSMLSKVRSNTPQPGLHFESSSHYTQSTTVRHQVC